MRKPKPTKAMLEARLISETPTGVHRALKAEGYDVSLARCSLVRNNLLRSGKAQTVLHQHYAARETIPSIEQQADSCHDLELAIKRLYRRRAKELGATPAAVRELLNYSRAQLEKMAA